MVQAAALKATTDPIWAEIRREVEQQVNSEPLLASFLHATVLKHRTLEESLSLHLAQKLGSTTLSEVFLREVIDDVMVADGTISAAIRTDLAAFRERDPACDRYSLPLLYLKGYQGLQAYRVGHWLWKCDRKELALYLQGRVSEVFGMDIHPAALIGSGILIDHATGIVIGETAVVGDNVSMLHAVTLGGTGKKEGDRHPKVHCGVLIGAGAKILGNVQIGEGAKIGAGSVVLEDIPPHSTAAGVPAQLVGDTECEQPALEMNHSLCRE